MASTQIEVKDYSYFANNQWRKALQRRAQRTAVSVNILSERLDLE